MDKISVLLVIVILAGICLAIDNDELPIGYYYPKGDDDADLRDSLRDDLGANIIVNGAYQSVTNIRDWREDGILSIPHLDSMANLSGQYTYACYSKWQAEDDTSEICFWHDPGCGVTTINDSTFLIVPPDTVDSNYIFLDDIWYRQPYMGSELLYRPALKIRARLDTSNFGDILGTLRVYQTYDWSGHDYVLVDSFPILADSFHIDSTHIDPTWIEIKYVFDDYRPSDSLSIITYDISTSSKCSLMVDYLEISNEFGRELIIEHDYDAYIIDAVTQSWGDKDTVFAWELRDEPQPDKFLPYRYVNDLIMAQTDSTVFGTSCYNWNANTGRCKSFLDLVEPRLLMTDLYSFYGPCWSYKTAYTGNGQTGDTHGLQKALYDNLVWKADSTRKLVELYNTTWWLAPQLFAGRGDEHYPCEDWAWRWPTPSELSCETFIGLCYRPDGLVYWKHGVSWDESDEHPGYMKGCCGLYDSTFAFLKDTLYNKLKDDIVPYIKAIDSTYLSLTWLEAGQTSGTDHVPNVDIISSIRAVPNNPDSISPDTGWFHIGVYQDDNDNYYFMLVNRACSKDEYGNEAGSITAIAEINRGMFDDAQSLYVIDLADSIGPAPNYQAFAETTYTTLYDSKLYFTTVLKAGEGRLFKIANV